MSIQISQSGSVFLNQLVEKQDEPGLGLRLRVTSPGTASASCELIFCAPDECKADDSIIVLSEINLYVEKRSLKFLDGAEIDYLDEKTGGRLNIKAPNIKGTAPADNAPLKDKVAWLIVTEVNPSLASHGGHVDLVDVSDEGVVLLRFGGGCHGCGMANVTLQNGIEKTLKEQLPQVTAVVDATDHASGENPYY
ncbi:MAG: NfuA family Fe-S biogenesis protein [Xanthomonadales bacterium]|nr:NfuA family Fe-S biogenesis protein [Xanthomonadales bacterium]